MGFFNNFRKTEQDPEVVYLRAQNRIQKQLGNITQKKLLIVTESVETLADKYSYPHWQTAELLSAIIDYGIKSDWQDCLDFALKTAKTLGRGSCLSLDKAEMKKVLARFIQ